MSVRVSGSLTPADARLPETYTSLEDVVGEMIAPPVSGITVLHGEDDAAFADLAGDVLDLVADDITVTTAPDADAALERFGEDGRRRYADDAAVEFLKTDGVIDLVDEPMTEFLHPDDQERAVERFESPIREVESAPEIEYRIRTVEGTTKRVTLVRARPPPGRDGRTGRRPDERVGRQLPARRATTPRPHRTATPPPNASAPSSTANGTQNSHEPLPPNERISATGAPRSS